MASGNLNTAPPTSSAKLGSIDTGFSLTATEVLAIIAFWTILAVITAASRRLDPRVELAPSIASAVATLAFIEYAIWAGFTIPIVWLSSRFSLEGGLKIARVIFFIALGVAIAIFVDSALAAARSHFLPFPTGRRFPAGGSRLSRLEFLDDLMVYFAVLGAGIARDYFVRYRARLEQATQLQAHAAQLEAQLALAQLAALRNQLDPHFLFNTLHAVSALVERDPKGVRRMISRLSELLRYNLEESHEHETTLEKELELVRRYVEIMEIRFQGRLSVEAELEESVKQALVPSLVLQPVVENAIKHGVGDREGDARIVIRARREGSQLVLTVTDTGPGIKDEPAPESPGIGLTNTRARLSQLYGSAQSFALSNAPAGGAVAEIRLPFHTRAEPEHPFPTER